jgi:hypothetical protein
LASALCRFSGSDIAGHGAMRPPQVLIDGITVATMRGFRSAAFSVLDVENLRLH